MATTTETITETVSETIISQEDQEKEIKKKELEAYHSETSQKVKQAGYTSFSDFFWNNTLSRLFLRRKFIAHRMMGLFYLIQYVLTIYFYITDYDYFLKSPFIWSLPLTGLLQSIIAVNTFTFLPKKQADPGYFSDRTVLSYNFIKENQFFAMLLLFAWVYYNERFFWIFKQTIIVEMVLVFFPYVLRTFFPKTRMRDALEVNDVKNSEKNRFFFRTVTYITKGFYIWAKHYIGFFLNYAQYLDRFTDEERYHLYLLLIFSAFATTIALFLHTLKFKGYIGPRTSFVSYMGSYFLTFYSYYQILPIFYHNIDISIIVFIGLLLNFRDKKIQFGYQALVFGLFASRRYGFIDPGVILY